MTTGAKTVLILGSAPNVVEARGLPKALFSAIVVINNAWRVRADWDYHISPDDFPDARKPPHLAPGQSSIGAADYVPANNHYGGVVYAGGTMAFSAGYWALAALNPTALVFYGCDMVYPTSGRAHFYGTGTADPLRDDVTLRNLEAKSARLMAHAAQQGCACLRAPRGASRLLFPTITLSEATAGIMATPQFDADAFHRAKQREAELGYFVESGRYWTHAASICPEKVDSLDHMWTQTTAVPPGGDAISRP
ncbi:hypothetical protein [uncultured Tateyamaria sp.]|uniref:hypothetical protein n=1 Tax=uncultured Tateyamaria sp. TaxID=455651 RepID=UPI00263045D4|nr:hypothetical protein [uncultured Tateyamaria sp.]